MDGFVQVGRVQINAELLEGTQAEAVKALAHLDERVVRQAWKLANPTAKPKKAAEKK